MPVIPPRLGLPPGRSRRRTAVVLAVLATAFPLSAGAFAGLSVAAGADHDAAVERVDQRRAELADLDDRVSASDAERQRTARHNGGLESENASLTDAERGTALDEAYPLCH